MKKLILFEGPDACGKTTLINSIKKEYDAYIHNGLYPSQQTAIDAYMDQFESFEKYNQSGLTLIDRAHWSEQVYGKVIRDTNLLLSDWDMLENKLNDIGAIVILCLAPFTIAAKR